MDHSAKSCYTLIEASIVTGMSQASILRLVVGGVINPIRIRPYPRDSLNLLFSSDDVRLLLRTTLSGCERESLGDLSIPTLYRFAENASINELGVLSLSSQTLSGDNA